MPTSPAPDLLRRARSLWDEPAVADPPGPMRRDWVLVALFGAALLLEGTLVPDVPWRPLAVISTLVLVLTLPWRRTHPLPMVLAAFGTFAVIEVARLIADEPPSELVSGAFVLLLAYSLFRWGSGRDAVIGLAVMLIPATLAAATGASNLGEMVGGFAVFFSTLAIGTSVRYRTSSRARLFEQIKLVEREQLARDLHDTVAHHVSAIAISAQAGLATAHDNPNSAVESLRVIESEAARTLTEMRSMVRTLRDGEPAALAPAPGLADLAAFTGKGGDGPTVHLEITGDADAVAPAVATVTYRIAQEAITNARRHARSASRVDVSVYITDDALELHVVDDGEPVRGRGAVQPGFGLLGMFERADLLGGRCEASPRSERGWHVRATLPIGGSGS